MKRPLILLTTLLLAPLAPLHAADGLPPFSWDRVPLNLHFGKRTTDLTDAEVEFVARFRLGGKAVRQHERSRFVREDGRWFYMDGDEL